MFVSPDSAGPIFDDSGVVLNGGNVTIAAGGVQPGTVNITNTIGTYTFSGGPINDISGNVTSVIKTGAGNLSLTSVNNFSGGITLAGGNTTVASFADLGTGAIIFNGGTLLATSDLSNSRNITFSGNGTINTNGIDMNFSGHILGGGTFIKSGAGTLTLSALETSPFFGGSAVVNGGTLELTTATTGTNFGFNILGDAPITVNNTGTLLLTNVALGHLVNNQTNGGNITLTNGGTLQTSGTTSFESASIIAALNSNGTTYSTSSVTIKTTNPSDVFTYKGSVKQSDVNTGARIIC